MKPDPARLATLHRQSIASGRAWSEAEFTQILAAPGSALATDDSGFALGRVVAGEGEVLMIVVLPYARRCGVGSRLLRDLETAMRAQGAQISFLEVASRNHPARTLYQNCGYRAAGIRKNYYRTPDAMPDDALILAKSLA